MKRLFEVCPAAPQGNRHQAKRRIESQMFAKSRQAFSESESRNYLRAEHTAQGA